MSIPMQQVVFSLAGGPLIFGCLAWLVGRYKLQDRHAIAWAMLGIAFFASTLWYFSDYQAIGRLIREGSRPLASSVFDVYHIEDAVVFYKDDCGAEDVDGTFVLHVHPVHPSVLPSWRMVHGFDNLDFTFDRYHFGNICPERFCGYSLHGGRRCATVATLPKWAIAKLDVGQVGPGGQGLEWREEFEVERRLP